MKRTLHLVILTITIALPMMLVPFMATAANSDEAKIEVAQKFLHAYLLKTEDVNPYISARREHLFSPYPFRGPVQLSTPKVHTNQALLEFTGAVTDAKLPRKAAILFYFHDMQWHVRQVLFYDEIPRLFGLPTKSITATDKAYEPTVRALGQSFLQAWERGEQEKMLAHWYNWSRSERKPVEGLHMSNLKMSNGATTWGDSYIGYSVKLTYKWGIFSYSMQVHGGLLLVNESGEWKVRGNQMVFNF